MVIVQYCRQIQAQRILNIMKKHQNDANPDNKVPIKGFKFRLCENEDMEKLSGYRFNAVTPFFMANESLPVILDESIAKLDPAYFWMGGGRVSLKIGTSISDFRQYVGDRLIVDSISEPLAEHRAKN